MSAIVKELLRTYQNIDDDTRMDLDDAIELLENDGKLSEKNRVIIRLLKEGYTVTSMCEVMGRKRRAICYQIRATTDLVATVMGEEYSDQHLLEMVEKKLKRSLTSDELQVCLHIIRNWGFDSKISLFNFKIVNGRVMSEN